MKFTESQLEQAIIESQTCQVSKNLAGLGDGTGAIERPGRSWSRTGGRTDRHGESYETIRRTIDE
ncbi:MAG: hypothetical protein ACOYL3_05460 [Desulfuromonadaceae bacterium]